MEKKKKSKINEFNILGVTIQVILTILMVIFLVLSLLVSKKLYSYFYLLVGLDLLAMAYNNKNIYKKDKVTIIYIIFGIIMIIYAILKFLGVI